MVKLEESQKPKILDFIQEWEQSMRRLFQVNAPQGYEDCVNKPKQLE